MRVSETGTIEGSKGEFFYVHHSKHLLTGSLMPIYCSRCGTGQRPDATQCHECGATIVRPMNENNDAARNHPSFKIKNIGLAVACGLYLVYPSFSVFELIPDAIPLVGSLDEATATAGLLYALSNLGWIPWKRSDDTMGRS